VAENSRRRGDLREVILNNGESGYAVDISTYNLENYDYFIGLGVLFLDKDMSPVGFLDDYNFEPSGHRSPLAELATLLGMLIGDSYGGQDYKIYYGLYGYENCD
jgi:hypothetical protein